MTVKRQEAPYIIFEIGVNHNGSIEVARQLIEASKTAGADAVKFQFFDPDHVVTKTAEACEYQGQATGIDKQYDLLRRLELTETDILELNSYANQLQIDFGVTFFDELSARKFKQLPVAFQKLPSGEIDNFLLLRELCSCPQTLIISTGMATLHEIRAVVLQAKTFGKNLSDISLLHCISSYPTAHDQCNLECLQLLKDEFDVDVGFSDHTRGMLASIVAATLGAKVIEKHITLDRNMQGPDHDASLEVGELDEFVKLLREVSVIKGDRAKIVSEDEAKNKRLVRRSIFMARDVVVGQLLCEEDFILLRPGTGVPAGRLESFIGTLAHKNFAKGEMFTEPL